MSVDVSYQKILLDSHDEADSLAGYLNEHGVFAVVQDTNEVSVVSENADTDQLIRTLRTTWRRFWDNSDSGLFGLPMFIKES